MENENNINNKKMIKNYYGKKLLWNLKKKNYKAEF